MENRELQTINAVLKNKDISVLFGNAVDELFVAYEDVWGSIKDYYHRHRSIPDIEILQERFPDLGKVEVKGETEYYLDSLKEEFLGNKIENIMTKAEAALDNDSPARVLAKLQASLSKLDRFANSARDLNIMDFDEAKRHFEEVRERAQANGGVPGVPTGIGFIDSSYPSGLAGGDLVVVLGWTGRGKSLLTTLVASNCHDHGGKPMLASLEMSGEKVRDRVFTIKGSGLFSNASLTLGDINIDDFRTFQTRNVGLRDFYVITNDGVGELTPNNMQAKIDQYKPTMLVFDYAQLGSDNANSQDMTKRMLNMSKEYKRLATVNDIPVVLISSATADSSSSAKEPPIIEQVAWSKQLAYDADLAFAVHKHDDSNIIEVACRKNRNGPLFDGFLDWDIDRGIISEKFDL